MAIPTMQTQTLRCRYAEHRDVQGALQAFADAPVHGAMHTFCLTVATQHVIGLGRLRNAVIVISLTTAIFIVRRFDEAEVGIS